MNLPKPKILAFFDFFFPAYKSGGPARSSLGLVETLGMYYDFEIFTRSTDKDFKEKLQGIESANWCDVKGAKVFYSTNAIQILKAAKKVEYDVYYFNSFFSAAYTILPLLLISLGILPEKPIILAPRGEFSENALAIKNWKKKIYLKLFNSFLYNKVIFHASSNFERWDIIKATRVKYSQVRVALNLRPISEFSAIQYKPITKESGELKLVFISRISAMKNIDFALRVLKNCKTNITLDIYGIVDDKAYWSECKTLIAELPAHIKVVYKSEVSQKNVFGVLQNYHVMFLPTRGENFGHSILESFMANRPALISNVTIWRNLEQQKAGWDLTLHDENLFVRKLDELNAMDNDTYQQFVSGAHQMAQNYFYDSEKVNAYKKLFDY
ncbi:MAG: glycosyltransferase family 4 protein [Bacteroidota bacterium]